MKINIIGAGFAGVEASYFLAQRGYSVNLYEMRDKKQTDVHQTNLFAELVCSNSFKSVAVENAHGLLKSELQTLNSLVINKAYENRVPAGQALAVDRDLFAAAITDVIKNHPNITVINEEVTDLTPLYNDEDIVIIATGPLTSPGLYETIAAITGTDSLFFFDAAAPIIDASTINYDKVFFQSRYDKGTADYLNAPFTKEEYYRFIEAIKSAEKVSYHDFENKKIFEGCMPIEVLADRGVDTLAFGAMKPVGLTDPHTGKRPYAVVQMRTENINKSMFNLVGFQTRMKWNEQKRVFRLIPGLENAEFFRYGVMHRNTYLNYPQIVDPATYSLKNNNNIYFAGQITGVEGYIESTASGLYTAYAVYARLNNKPLYMPVDTMIGNLQKYTITENDNYQPLASNFGILNRDVYNDKGKKLKKRDKKKRLAEDALKSIKAFSLFLNF